MTFSVAQISFFSSTRPVALKYAILGDFCKRLRVSGFYLLTFSFCPFSVPKTPFLRPNWPKMALQNLSNEHLKPVVLPPKTYRMTTRNQSFCAAGPFFCLRGAAVFSRWSQNPDKKTVLILPRGEQNIIMCGHEKRGATSRPLPLGTKILIKNLLSGNSYFMLIGAYLTATLRPLTM